MQAELDWPFEDAPDVMCFTVRSIVDGSQPILMATRDAEDGGWSFLTGEALDMSQALLVTLRSMVERDVTLLGLVDLLPGWMATRSATQDAWMRSPCEVAEDEG